MARPFRLAEAYERGLTWRSLQSRRWRRVSVGTYVAASTRETVELRLLAVSLRLPPGCAFSGPTAAWLHDLESVPDAPIEVTAPAGLRISTRSGVRLRRMRLEPCEVEMRRGLTTTSPLRTLLDLGAQRDLTEAVVALDSGLHRGLIAASDLRAAAARLAGAKGSKRLRKAVAMADGASESPMETRLRVLLVLAGLPCPVVQAHLVDSDGVFVARVDLCYPTHRLCIEYDGGGHRENLVLDDRRQNRLVEEGYQILRFTASDVYTTPARVVALVREALRQPAVARFV